MDTPKSGQPPYNGQTVCPLPTTVCMLEPLKKGQPPNNGQNTRPQRVHCSEVPLYTDGGAGVQVNEAFAAQYVAVERELGLDREKTNTNGGAIGEILQWQIYFNIILHSADSVV